MRRQATLDTFRKRARTRLYFALMLLATLAGSRLYQPTPASADCAERAVQGMALMDAPPEQP